MCSSPLCPSSLVCVLHISICASRGRIVWRFATKTLGWPLLRGFWLSDRFHVSSVSHYGTVKIRSRVTPRDSFLRGLFSSKVLDVCVSKKKAPAGSMWFSFVFCFIAKGLTTLLIWSKLASEKLLQLLSSSRRQEDFSFFFLRKELMSK